MLGIYMLWFKLEQQINSENYFKLFTACYCTITISKNYWQVGPYCKSDHIIAHSPTLLKV